MFGIAGRRAAEVLVGLFALLGFVCVPLGQKTGLQHVLAIARTPQVLEAASELMDAALRVKARAVAALSDSRENPDPVSPASSASPQPVVPRLRTR